MRGEREKSVEGTKGEIKKSERNKRREKEE